MISFNQKFRAVVAQLNMLVFDGCVLIIFSHYKQQIALCLQLVQISNDAVPFKNRKTIKNSCGIESGFTEDLFDDVRIHAKLFSKELQYQF